MNVSVNDNEGIRSFVLNITVQTFAVITKTIFTFFISQPKPLSNKNFDKEFLRASIDIEKAVKGINNNFITASIFRNILESFDHEVKYPFKRVRNEFKTLYEIEVLLF